MRVGSVMSSAIQLAVQSAFRAASKASQLGHKFTKQDPFFDRHFCVPGHSFLATVTVCKSDR